MKQMTSGMMVGRGFFPPGKGGRRGFPLIGEDFGYFGPHDKPPFPNEFGYPPNFPPPPDGFFPGPMGFMGKILLHYMNTFLLRYKFWRIEKHRLSYFLYCKYGYRNSQK